MPDSRGMHFMVSDSCQPLHCNVCFFVWRGCWRSSHPILILETRKKKREIKRHIPLPYGYSPGISQILPTFHWPGFRHSHTTLQCDLYFVPSHDQLIFRGSITEEREDWYWRTPNSLCYRSNIKIQINCRIYISSLALLFFPKGEKKNIFSSLLMRGIDDWDENVDMIWVAIVSRFWKHPSGLYGGLYNIRTILHWSNIRN